MNSRRALLVVGVVAMFAVAGCAQPSIPAEDVASVCAATGAAMQTVDQAMLATAEGQVEWGPALAAVEEVVEKARESGYPAAVEWAEDWQASVVAAATAPDRQSALSHLIESQGSFGLVFMCDAAGARVPGVEPIVGDGLEPAMPGWVAAAAWLVFGAAAAVAAVVHKRRSGSALIRAALQGLLAGSLLVLVVTVVAGGWLLADLELFGLGLSPLDGIWAVLTDPTTPVWALLLGGSAGAIIGSTLHLLRRRSRQGISAQAPGDGNV